MKRIQKLALAITMLLALQVSAQNTSDAESIDENATIESFQLPTFSELSNDIATEYTNVLERLPNLSNIGKYVQKSIRRGLLDDNNISATFRNLTTEFSILPNITGRRFQLRDNLNNIMFTGFDANQLHMNESYRGGQ